MHSRELRSFTASRKNRGSSFRMTIRDLDFFWKESQEGDVKPPLRVIGSKTVGEGGFDFGENPRAQSRVTVPPKAGLKKGLRNPRGRSFAAQDKDKADAPTGIRQVHDTRRDCKVVHLFLWKK